MWLQSNTQFGFPGIPFRFAWLTRYISISCDPTDRVNTTEEIGLLKNWSCKLNTQ